MKNITFTFATLCFIAFLVSCQKTTLDNTPILEDRAYSIEKITCDNNNRFFDWVCSFNQNYIQKDITTEKERNFTFSYRSDNFNTTGYGFRTIVFVNNAIRYRASTRTFPFETTLKIPAGSVVSVKTYFEQFSSANGDDSGKVNCRVSAD